MVCQYRLFLQSWTCCRYGADEELPVDYAFLDEDEELDYNSVDSFLGADRFMRRKRSADCENCLNTGLHVVYKRRDVSDDTHGDYSECLCCCADTKYFQDNNLTFFDIEYSHFYLPETFL